MEPKNPEDRWWSKVVKTEHCWLWTGRLNKDGYGSFDIHRRREGIHKSFLAHKWGYESFVGTIANGFELDHTCRIRNCVRFDHLEVVTHGDNIRRGTAAQRRRARTHCPKGHPYDEENTAWRRKPSGGYQRVCRECGRAACRDWGHRTRAKRNEQRVLRTA